MACLGFEPGAAWWKARTNPLSYGGTPTLFREGLGVSALNVWTIGLERQTSLVTFHKYNFINSNSTNEVSFVGDRYSSVDSSTILWPRVQIPIYASIFHFKFELHCEKDANNEKETVIGPYLKTKTLIKFLETGFELEYSSFKCSITTYHSSIH